MHTTYHASINVNVCVCRGYERRLNSTSRYPNELHIVNVRPSHAGVYACKATSDTFCTIFSENATLTIVGKLLVLHVIIAFRITVDHVR